MRIAKKGLFLILACVLAFNFVLNGSAFAATYKWTGKSEGNWSDTNNWTVDGKVPTQAPTATDSIYIGDNGGNVASAITIDKSVVVSDMEIGSYVQLRLNNDLTARNLSINSRSTIEFYGNGTFMSDTNHLTVIPGNCEVSFSTPNKAILCTDDTDGKVDEALSLSADDLQVEACFHYGGVWSRYNNYKIDGLMKLLTMTFTKIPQYPEMRGVKFTYDNFYSKYSDTAIGYYMDDGNKGVVWLEIASRYNNIWRFVLDRSMTKYVPPNGESLEGFFNDNNPDEGSDGTSPGTGTRFDPIWPCESNNAYYVTCLYSYGTTGSPKGLHAVLHSPDVRHAVDIAGGGNIVAVEDGTVTKVTRPENLDAKGFGNRVQIRHNYGDSYIYTFYAHLDSVTVNSGDNVVKGQKIGVMGDTGARGATHVHFEMFEIDDDEHTPGSDECDPFMKYYKVRYGEKISFNNNVLVNNRDELPVAGLSDEIKDWIEKFYTVRRGDYWYRNNVPLGWEGKVTFVDGKPVLTTPSEPTAINSLSVSDDEEINLNSTLTVGKLTLEPGKSLTLKGPGTINLTSDGVSIIPGNSTIVLTSTQEGKIVINLPSGDPGTNAQATATGGLLKGVRLTGLKRVILEVDLSDDELSKLSNDALIKMLFGTNGADNSNTIDCPVLYSSGGNTFTFRQSDTGVWSITGRTEPSNPTNPGDPEGDPENGNSNNDKGGGGCASGFTCIMALAALISLVAHKINKA